MSTLVQCPKAVAALANSDVLTMSMINNARAILANSVVSSFPWTPAALCQGFPQFVKPEITVSDVSKGRSYRFKIEWAEPERLAEIKYWYEAERSKYPEAYDIEAEAIDRLPVLPRFETVGKDGNVQLVTFDREKHGAFATLFKLFWCDA